MGILECGISATRVAQRFGCSRVTVYNFQERHQATGTTANCPRSSRAIVCKHIRNTFRTATQTARETPGRNNLRISRFTVCRRLSPKQFCAYGPYVGPVLTEQRMWNRARWAVTMAKHNGVYRPGVVWCSSTSLGIVFLKLTAGKGCIGEVTNDFNVTTFVKLIGWRRIQYGLGNH